LDAKLKDPILGLRSLIWMLKDPNLVPLCCYSQTRSNSTILALLSVLLMVVAGLRLNRRLVAGLGYDGRWCGSRFLESLSLPLSFVPSPSLPQSWCREGRPAPDSPVRRRRPRPQLAVLRPPSLFPSLPCVGCGAGV